MKYSELCKVYKELEENPSRLKKTEILSEFLKKLKHEKNLEIIYLLRGRIFPDYDAREIGISTQSVIKALAKSTSISDKEIVKLWKKSGDLGEVAESIMHKRTQSALFKKELTSEKVLENLKKLPGLEGKGTVNKKIALISELLISSSSLEAKYIVRTLLSDLRIGLGEGVLRDSIVWACLDKEDKSSYAAVQEAYDSITDFALVFEKACKSKTSLENTELEPGKPVKVMLALKADNIKDGFETVGIPAAIEYKYDGFRCITGYTQLYIKGRGFLSARHIKKGDYILSHKGRFRKILEVNKRKIAKGERLFKVQSFYGDSFKISEKHPILVYRGGLKWINPERIKKEDKLLFPIPQINIKFPYKKHLNLQDESGYTKQLKLNKFFFRFLGYWIGDGFTNDYHNTERVGLIFNKNDKELLEYYEKGIKKMLSIKKISKNIHNGAVYLYWRDKPLRLWLSEYFRREWKGKTLPDWFMGINSTQFNEFINGWIESDGHTDNIGRTNITTKERDLAMFASLLGLKFKRMIGIKKLVINKKDYYKLVIPKSNRGFSILNKNYFLIDILRIEEIKRPFPRTNLYNFQVDIDESYCGPMIALHNCMINKDENGEIKVFTRRLEQVTNQFPEVKEYVKKYVKGDSFILDAEAVGFDAKTKRYKPFQEISQRIKRKYDIEKLQKELPIELNVFDIIYYNGKSLIKTPFKERTELLRKIIKPEKFKLVPSKQIITSDEKEAEKFYQEALKEGEEGVMIKKLDSPYKPGARVGHMLKLKPSSNELDLVIVKAEAGTGKRGGWLTSFTIACRKEHELLEIGKVSTGLKEKPAEGVSFEEMTKKLRKLIISEKGREVIVKPEVIITVTYQDIQKSPSYSSGFALRFPRFTALREDKSIKDIATIEEVERDAEKSWKWRVV